MEYEKTLPSLDLLTSFSSGKDGEECGKEKKFTQVIDNLVFQLPNYDFNTATSWIKVPYEKVKGIIPIQMTEYLNGNPDGHPSMEIFARSRTGKDVSVSLAMGEKRVSFGINQGSGCPELYFEKNSLEDQWQMIDDPYELTWDEFEAGLFVVTSVVDAVEEPR